MIRKGTFIIAMNLINEHNAQLRQMIECIKVYPDGKLDIIFNGGYTIVEHINLK